MNNTESFYLWKSNLRLKFRIPPCIFYIWNEKVAEFHFIHENHKKCLNKLLRL